MNQTVMPTRNLNVECGLVNGCVGVIKDFCKLEDDNDYNKIDFVVVEFRNYSESSNISENNVKLVAIKKEIAPNGAFNFPLVPASAMTIHKITRINIQF